MKPKTLTGALLLGALFLTTTNASATTPKKIDPTNLEPFEKCSDLRDHLAEAYSEQLAWSLSYPLHRYRHGGPRPSAQPTTAAKSRDASRDESGGPSSYTKTNVQEQGVDENDRIKTDGRYVYSVSGKSVSIIKSWPVDESEVVGKVTFDQANINPSSLFLRGDKLVVLSSMWEPASNNTHKPFNGTRVSIVDISDRTNPKIERQDDIEGWSYQSRMIGDDVYLVFNANIQAPPSVFNNTKYNEMRPAKYLDWQQQQKFVKRTAKKLFPKVRRDVGRIALDDLMPKHRTVRGDGRVVATQPMLQCSQLRSNGSKSMSVVGVAHIDIDDPSDFGATALLGHGWNIYASKNNLYVSGTTYGWWHGQDPSDYYNTYVHKFRLRGENGQPTYAASGKVDGWVLNQFSMSEWDGDLRIGTTDWNVPGQNGGGNHLTVLREVGGKLLQIGAVRGLAKGERIYSMRMMGDIGYMVTFRQTDPLYTIDLSNPTKPKVLGELKINGFSSYIHPLGPNHLLTVGQDADDDGRVLGLHLQIFDVTDLANPTRVHHKRLTGERWSSWSPAMWDHHAFTFDAKRKILVLPMTMNQPEQFSGALVLRADPRKGFKDMGFLTQNGKVAERFCERATPQQNRAHCENPYNTVWASAIQRTIIVDDYVLALSHYGMTAHSLNRPHRTLASVFTYDTPHTYYGYVR